MPTTHPFRRRAAAATLAATMVLGVAACGDDEEPKAATAQQQTDRSAQDSTATEGHDVADSEAVATDSAAADLRASLTAGLQEHVYLAGIAVYAAVNTPDAFEPAADALDANTVELSEMIGSVYGDEAAAGFLDLWRSHIGMFVDYANAKATGDQAKADKAQADLAQYGKDFGEFLEGANPNLKADAIASALDTHVATLSAAIDATVAKDSSAFTKLREAAAHMPMTAKVLAGGIAKQFPDKFGG